MKSGKAQIIAPSFIEKETSVKTTKSKTQKKKEINLEIEVDPEEKSKLYYHMKQISLSRRGPRSLDNNRHPVRESFDNNKLDSSTNANLDAKPELLIEKNREKQRKLLDALRSKQRSELEMLHLTPDFSSENAFVLHKA